MPENSFTSVLQNDPKYERYLRKRFALLLQPFQQLPKSDAGGRAADGQNGTRAGLHRAFLGDMQRRAGLGTTLVLSRF